jgi:hypothetical protein
MMMIKIMTIYAMCVMNSNDDVVMLARRERERRERGGRGREGTFSHTQPPATAALAIFLETTITKRLPPFFE